MNIMQTIELESSSGSPQPKQLIVDILANTGITVDDLTLLSNFKGNYTWQVNENKVTEYLMILPIVRDRIRQLYHNGVIKYGSW